MTGMHREEWGGVGRVGVEVKGGMTRNCGRKEGAHPKCTLLYFLHNPLPYLPIIVLFTFVLCTFLQSQVSTAVNLQPQVRTRMKTHTLCYCEKRRLKRGARLRGFGRNKYVVIEREEKHQLHDHKCVSAEKGSCTNPRRKWHKYKKCNYLCSETDILEHENKHCCKTPGWRKMASLSPPDGFSAAMFVHFCLQAIHQHIHKGIPQTQNFTTLQISGKLSPYYNSFHLCLSIHLPLSQVCIIFKQLCVTTAVFFT